MRSRSVVLTFLAAGAICGIGYADIAGSQDHPLISRYPGSQIMDYSMKDFDGYPLPTAVVNKRPASPVNVQGKVTRIYYQNPKGRSTLEIFSNYDQALKQAGFQDVFRCEGAACGIGSFWTTFNKTMLSGSGDPLRYVAAKLKKGKLETHVAVMVSPGATSLHVIEGQPMEAGLVEVNAAVMADEIDRFGHVNLYGIYFDTDKADLKPESSAAIDQIAQLMQGRPALKLHVVGHTDNTGTLAHNMQLSADRATAVVTALSSRHKIGAARLMPHGVGPLAPVAANTKEEGRAKNRRVDLVAQ